MDVAASEFFENGFYNLDFKGKGDKKDQQQMIDFYKSLIEKYDLISIEDPFDQDDFSGYEKLTSSSSIQIVGDDLLVTNPKRIKEAIEKKTANAMSLVKAIEKDREQTELVILSIIRMWCEVSTQDYFVLS